MSTADGARPLVRCAAIDDTSVASDSDVYEPGLFVPIFKGLGLPNDDSGRNATFLAHSIARSPTNLRHHVMRINLHIAARDEARLWGALIDLFLVLGSDGTALKQRMLAQSKGLLDAQRVSFLSTNLEDGLGTNGYVPETVTSVLYRGAEGTRWLVKRSDRQDATERDPLLDAREHIEYGQVDQAQKILERALRDEPQREDLHYELLAIYRGKRDLQALMTTFGSLAIDENPVPHAWEDAAGLLQGAS